ncbi:MAG TPA: divergent polysaccharide deacetylase family protein, partial [Alphaproteobacteria bacterium]|nr:divergent polysaccharide deacetylase family protein [Alphaproteobacteria bacterium]
MGKRAYSNDTLKFIVIAVGLMLAVHFLTDRISAVLAPPPADAPKKEEAVSYGLYGPPEKPRVTVLRNTKTIDVSKPFGMNLPEEALIYAKPPEKEPEKPPVLLAEPQEPPPAPIKNPPKKIHKGPRAKLAVIIDDMGLTANRDKAVVAMPGPLTLAYLPYAPGVAGQARNAKAAGHELLIHTPMEPMNGRINPGPIALMTDMDEAEFRRVLREDVLPSFEGYVGINNHMGSRLTQDPKAMQWLMEELKAKDLVFVDSITIQSSRAAAVAAHNGVPFARRDV